MTGYLAGGLVYGSLYAIAALGLVLTFKSSRVFNFAYGAIAYTIAIFYYELTVVRDWPVLAGLAVCLLVVAPLMGAFLTLAVFRHLRNTAVSVQVVATIGLFVAIPAVVRFVFGNDSRFDAVGLFRGERPVYDILGARVNRDQVAIVVAAAVIAAVCGLLLRFTRVGLAVRAVVDEESLASLLGMNPRAIDAGAGAVSAFTAGLAGILMTPVLGLAEAGFDVLLIASIAAVVIGGLRSMTWTFVGAIGLGLLQGVAAKLLPDTGIWSRGLRPSLPFIVIFLALTGYSILLIVRHTPLEAVGQGLGGHVARSGTRVFRWVSAGIFVLLVLGAPLQMSGSWTEILASGIALGIILLSYVLITGEGQMVSLCQVTFAGIGAIATAQLVTVHHWPVVLGILAGGIIAMPVGALISMACLRLGPLYLALGTLGFAMLVDNLVFPIARFDQLGLGVAVERPSLLGIDLGTDVRFYFFALAVFALMALLVANVRSSTSGMGLAAMRSAEPAAAMLGVNVLGLRIAAFTLSAFIAGVGGGVLASSSRVALPSAFGAVVGLVWLAALVTFGVRRLSAALVGGILVAAFPRLFSQYFSNDLAEVPSMLFGLGAIGVARDPGGVIEAASSGLLGLGDRVRHLLARGDQHPEAGRDRPSIDAEIDRADTEPLVAQADRP